MAKIDVRYLPRGNPCAQCSMPIAAPDWIENGPHRTSYLWHCQVCDYRFEGGGVFRGFGNRSIGGLTAGASEFRRSGGRLPASLANRQLNTNDQSMRLPVIQ